jgi:hypothetical protein
MPIRSVIRRFIDRTSGKMRFQQTFSRLQTIALAGMNIDRTCRRIARAWLHLLACHCAAIARKPS